MARERLLAAEAAIRREIESVLRSSVQVSSALVRVQAAPGDELLLYGLAALLDTSYSGVEKLLTRALSTFEGVPTGTSWHRELLDAATLHVEGVRPAVIQASTAHALDPYRSFRHRFRNLYLYDLEAEPVLTLARELGAVVEHLQLDIECFSAALRGVAE